VISLSHMHLGALRLHELHRANTAERLRRAGYADQERTPRQPRHWANR
jgi:hypothetical protein